MAMPTKTLLSRVAKLYQVPNSYVRNIHVTGTLSRRFRIRRRTTNIDRSLTDPLGRQTSGPVRSDGVRAIPRVNLCPTNCMCSNDLEFDYRNVRLLSQFVSPMTGMILGRKITGLCGRRQRQLTSQIKRSRWMGLMPFTTKMPQYMNDPQLF
ncbi:small ribosomal subunit protein bS18-like [Corticium candelabrum]|uniref:small ribosomal subunit protein bS18-like n=1 Tax=Corticium candelabrum TaxID=121492 RepID=UPI002E26382E|nr:small ribosomal subunit protein bS18-like [Corticium candelabrum]